MDLFIFKQWGLGRHLGVFTSVKGWMQANAVGKLAPLSESLLHIPLVCALGWNAIWATSRPLLSHLYCDLTLAPSRSGELGLQKFQATQPCQYTPIRGPQGSRTDHRDPTGLLVSELSWYFRPHWASVDPRPLCLAPNKLASPWWHICSDSDCFSWFCSDLFTAIRKCYVAWNWY